MMKFFPPFLLFLGFSFNSFSQLTDSASNNTPVKKANSVYKIKPWLDIPATLVLDGLSLNGMRVIYGREPLTEAEVLALNKNNINRFDRPVANNYSENAKSTSDLFFYGSMPLPLFLMLDPAIRKDGLKVGLLFLETMGATGTLYTTSAMIANRYRPYTYNSNVDLDTRRRGGARNSFYAGHPAVVATSTFFMAKIYSDYHPNMKHKWILFAVAGTAAATTAYLRVKAGQHFKTDVITGVLIGSAVGVLVPHLHKNKNADNRKLTLLPNFQLGGGTGFTAFYKLGS